MTVLEQIPLMADEQLSTLLFNSLEYLRQGKMPEQANAIKAAILDEWAKRLERFKAGEYKADAPEHGVLNCVGYKVGNDGISRESRRYLLDYIMSGDLPATGSPAHMAEWGKPGTHTRYRKLHRVLRVLASSAKTKGNMDKAAREWEEDLEYLEIKWSKSCI